MTGTAAATPAPRYTGTSVLGIATMHKSNAVQEFTEPSPEFKEFVADMRAILQVERNWLFVKESQYGQ